MDILDALNAINELRQVPTATFIAAFTEQPDSEMSACRNRRDALQLAQKLIMALNLSLPANAEKVQILWEK